MSFAGVILVAFTPGLFWLWLFVRIDRIRPAPRRLIALSFVLGMASTIPVGIINSLTIDDSIFETGVSLSAVAVAMLLIVGPVEETSKFLAVRIGAFRSAYFQEPSDGLVYSAAASLGFASLENVLYVALYGPEVMVLRAPLSTLAHLVFGSLWGYGLGLHQRSGRRRVGLLLVTLAGAALLHASFNIAVFSAYPLVSFGIVALGAAWAYRRFEWGERISPFRYRRNYPLFECLRCHGMVRVTSQFCPQCGAPATADGAPIVCGNCKHLNRPGALYCTRCGDRFLQ